MDGSNERGLSRPLKAALAALVLAGLLAIVALAARGGHPGGHGQLHQREVPAWVGNDLLTIIVIAYAVAAVAFVVAFILASGEWTPPTRRTWLRHLMTLGVLLAALALLGYRSVHHLRPNHGATSQAQQQQQGRGRGRRSTLPKLPAARRPAEFDWALAAGIGGALLLLGVFLLARRRPDAEVEEEETVEEELVTVVSDTIDDLRREADARRAVIAAYARMEHVLGNHGHPRRPSEAPFEYLARILLTLQVRAAAVADLTELFERAKFSAHEIDQSMKERAIAALVSVRTDLQPAPA